MLQVRINASVHTLQPCFTQSPASSCRLMDADGSGAIGSDELSSAFKVSSGWQNSFNGIHTRLNHLHAVQLLGIKASMATINKMITDAGADESGEVGYDAFVAMMEPILSAKGTTTSKNQPMVASGSTVSFETTINEYRRSVLRIFRL